MSEVKAWPPDRQHQHQLGTQKCMSSDPTAHLPNQIHIRLLRNTSVYCLSVIFIVLMFLSSMRNLHTLYCPDVHVIKKNLVLNSLLFCVSFTEFPGPKESRKIVTLQIMPHLLKRSKFQKTQLKFFLKSARGQWTDTKGNVTPLKFPVFTVGIPSTWKPNAGNSASS